MINDHAVPGATGDVKGLVSRFLDLSYDIFVYFSSHLSQRCSGLCMNMERMRMYMRKS
jgi:hypothetical protein